MKNVILGVGLLLTMASAFGQFKILPAPNCGKYSLVRWNDGSYSCERFAVFPWYTAGAGWKTEIPAFVAPVPPVNGVSKGSLHTFGFGAGPNLGFAPANIFFVAFGGPYGKYGYFSVAQPVVLSNRAVRLDLVAGATCTSLSTCATSPQLAVGSVWVQIDAPDVQTLEATSMQLVYLFADPSLLGINTWQVAVPPVYYDLAKPKWMTSFSETTLAQKNSLNANNMSFAIANLGTQPQAVRVSLYDLSGTLITQRDTPALGPSVLLNNSQNQIVQAGFRIPGGVYADTFANYFGLNTSMLNTTAQQAAARMGTIDGTIRFEALGGQPIAPLVVRNSGQSNTVLLVSTFE